jgi:hypothetical protein
MRDPLQRWLYPELDLFESAVERRRALRASQRNLAPVLFGCLSPALGFLVLAIVDRFTPIAPRDAVALVLAGSAALAIFIGCLWHRRLTRRRLRVELTKLGQAICLECGYDLRGQVESRCPECGRAFDRAPPCNEAG